MFSISVVEGKNPKQTNLKNQPFFYTAFQLKGLASALPQIFQKTGLENPEQPLQSFKNMNFNKSSYKMLHMFTSSWVQHRYKYT